MRFNALIPELGVTDLAKSLDFYVGLIGFSVAYDRPEEGFAFLELGEAQLMLDTIGMAARSVRTSRSSAGASIFSSRWLTSTASSPG